MLIWFALVGASSAAEKSSSMATDTHASPLQLVMEDTWRESAPPHMAVIFKGGGFVSDAFPALSADGSRVALLYDANHPLQGGYPTFELWSTRTLKRVRSIPLMPLAGTRVGNMIHPPREDAQLAAVERELGPINQLLARDGFQPVEKFFAFNTYRYPYAPIEKWGLRVTYDGRRKLKIETEHGKRTLLEVDFASTVLKPMGDDPNSFCSTGGVPEEGWYVPSLRLAIIRVTRPGNRDGCEEPEEWLLKRL